MAILTPGSTDGKQSKWNNEPNGGTIKMTNEERTMEVRTIKKMLVEKNKPIFDESAYEVEIQDDAAGEYLVVRQLSDKCGEITIEAEEWPTLRELINDMMEECRCYTSS